MNNTEIIQYLEYSPELRELVTDIINLKNKGAGFRECLKFAGITEEQSNKIDSAYPCDYGRSIAEIYPDFYKGLNCYDYNTATFGAMRNIKNDIANRILKHF